MHEVMLKTAELTPGMFVRVDQSWKDHPFLMNQFMLKSEADVEKVRSYANKIYVIPGKSKVPIFFDEDAPDEAVAAPPPVGHGAGLKQTGSRKVSPEDIEKLQEIRTKITEVQGKYVDSIKKSSKAFERLESMPAESVSAIKEVISESVEIISLDPNSAINLVLSANSAQTEVAHGISVMTTALVLGRAIGLNSSALEVLATGAMLHDVGKRALPWEILQKKQRNPKDEEVYKTHCKQGVEIMKNIGIKTQGIYDAILYHHEKFEGGGYPYGIGGTQIPITARIVAICERFDKLTNMPDPEQSLTPSHALGRMFKSERGFFDPSLLSIFIKKMGVFPPGTLVELNDGRYAVVLVTANQDTLKPQVMVYEKGVPKSEAAVLDLEKEENINIVKSIRGSDIPIDVLEYLMPKRNISYFLSKSY